MHTTEALARELGVAPSRESGQHFLVDKKILARIVKTASVKKGENILEIGPGFGALTSELIQKGANVVAVEFDRKLARHLSGELKDSKARIVQGDILSFSNQAISGWFGSKSYRVVANIPYHITGKIIKKFVSSELPKPASLVLLVQREVAERVVAKPGHLSLLALSVQLYAEPSIAFEVPKESFWPIPEVDSALLAIDDVQEKPRTPPQSPPWQGGEAERFWQIVRIGFSSPRKQLRNNLAAGLSLPQDVIKKALKQSNLPETSRAQELSILDWIAFIRALEKK
ncbi:MAG: ribosomal RNA small subunit methyltransferase A [Candidatus Sungbacteria bacterium]|uniref:Ribosomal RNA small subunit methyltransferase A n=1 Tax=Candidatus Sungiibacteriota bacterium TaxID=2750080 RepID=A0A932YXK0_9BACT|nr:ribosomal RNA small subunit methyltransferase A [Parcubacteria group bacterium]MBI4132930.1 ribosomal RNA small subunit methyltransferase A [Candidatus Sungbacteria bacterium]